MQSSDPPSDPFPGPDAPPYSDLQSWIPRLNSNGALGLRAAQLWSKIIYGLFEPPPNTAHLDLMRGDNPRTATERHSHSDLSPQEWLLTGRLNDLTQLLICWIDQHPRVKSADPTPLQIAYEHARNQGFKMLFHPWATETPEQALERLELREGLLRRMKAVGRLFERLQFAVKALGGSVPSFLRPMIDTARRIARVIHGHPKGISRQEVLEILKAEGDPPEPENASQTFRQYLKPLGYQSVRKRWFPPPGGAMEEPSE